LSKDKKKSDWIGNGLGDEVQVAPTAPPSKIIQFSDMELGLESPENDPASTTRPEITLPDHLNGQNTVPQAAEPFQPASWHDTIPAEQPADGPTKVWEPGTRAEDKYMPLTKRLDTGELMRRLAQATSEKNPPQTHTVTEEQDFSIDPPTIPLQQRSKKITKEQEFQPQPTPVKGLRPLPQQPAPMQLEVITNAETLSPAVEPPIDLVSRTKKPSGRASPSRIPPAQAASAPPVAPTSLRLDAPSRVNIRMVGQISPRSVVQMMTQPGSIIAEQYRVLALKLKERADIRVISVLTPSDDVEGSAVAANIALALAEGSRITVVLVDANLRRSRVGDLFGIVVRSEDLAQQLRYHQRHPDVPWDVLGIGKTFNILPALPMGVNPSALLNSETMWELLHELRQEFDYIVLTTPPVMEAADAVILQDHADGAILAAGAGTTRQDVLRASLSRLGEGKVVGTVLLNVKKLPRIQ